MHILKITRLEPGKVVSFHVRDSRAPEEEVFARFHTWAAANGLLERHRFIPLLGCNHPWGPVGEPRGYEVWCYLDGLGDVEVSGHQFTEGTAWVQGLLYFSGGLYAVTTIPGIDVIPEYAQRLRHAVEAHPRYTANYPEGYRHGIDPVPELEMVYTPRATQPEDFVLDYFVPIREIDTPRT